MIIRPLLPTLREKKRYLSYTITSEKPLKAAETNHTVMETVSSFLGTFGCALGGVQLVHGDNHGGIIRTNNHYIDHVKSALMMIQHIGNSNTVVQTIRVSGILRKAEQGGIIHATG